MTSGSLVSRGPVVIAGGGIAGLAAARALSIAGQGSIVLEQATEFEEIGAGIQLGPNGFRVLEALGVREVVERAAVFPDHLVIMDGVSEQEITRIPVTGAFRARFGQPYALVHRADLHRALLDVCTAAANIELRSSTAFASYEDTGDGVLVATKGGATVEAKALIGADGLWSKTRDAIVGTDRRAYPAILLIAPYCPSRRSKSGFATMR